MLLKNEDISGFAYIKELFLLSANITPLFGVCQGFEHVAASLFGPQNMAILRSNWVRINKRRFYNVAIVL